MPQVTLEDIGYGTSGDDLDSWIATRHTCSWGITGSGKTTMIDEITHRLQAVRVVIWNPEEHPFRGSKRVTSSAQLVDELAKGTWLLDYVPEVDAEEMPEHFNDVMAPIWQLGTQFKGSKEKAEPWILLVVDEVDLVAPEQGKISSLFDGMMRRGRKRGIFIHSSSQRPADVDKIVPTQSLAHFVFALQLDDLEYLRRRKLPVDEFKSYIQQEHQFVVVEFDKWAAVPALPREDRSGPVQR